MQYTQPLASAPPTLVQYRPGIGRWAQQAALCAARARQDPSRTRQSLLTLATFRSWGIHWMTPHEGPSERLPDPVPGCEPAPTDSTRPCLSSRTHRRARGLSWEVRPRALRCVHTGTDATKPASRDRSHRPGLAPEMGGPIYSFLVARGCRRVERLEDSPSGLWRTLGKRVGCKPSGVRIPHPPPPIRDRQVPDFLCLIYSRSPGPLSPGPGFTPSPAFSRRRRPTPSLPLPITQRPATSEIKIPPRIA